MEYKYEIMDNDKGIITIMFQIDQTEATLQFLEKKKHTL